MPAVVVAAIFVSIWLTPRQHRAKVGCLASLFLAICYLAPRQRRAKVDKEKHEEADQTAADTEAKETTEENDAEEAPPDTASSSLSNSTNESIGKSAPPPATAPGFPVTDVDADDAKVDIVIDDGAIYPGGNTALGATALTNINKSDAADETADAAAVDETPSTSAVPDPTLVASYTSIVKEGEEETEEHGTEEVTLPPDAYCSDAVAMEEGSTFIALHTLRGSFAAVSGAAASLRRSGSKASSRKLDVDDSQNLRGSDYTEDRKTVTHQVAVPNRVRGATDMASNLTPKAAMEASVSDRSTRRGSTRFQRRLHLLSSRNKSPAPPTTSATNAADDPKPTRTLADILHSTSSSRLETERTTGVPSVSALMEATVAPQGGGCSEVARDSPLWRPPIAAPGRYVRRNHRGEKMSHRLGPASTHMRHPPPGDQWWFGDAMERTGKIIGEMRRSIKRNAARL